MIFDEPCSTAPDTILLVEDEYFISLMLSFSIKELGFQVIQAATADDALSVLRNRSTRQLW
jgi:DNA-binding response OmpR family regulator